MNSKNFSDAMSNIDSKYIDEALNYKKKSKKSVWIKWGAIAACITFFTVLGLGLFQSGLLGSKTDVATLDNGNEIIFVESDSATGSLSNIDIAVNITSHQLTGEEVTAIFPNLPVTADAIFAVDGTSSDSNKKLIGFDGKIGNVRMVISTSDIQLLDTRVDGIEVSTEVDGTSVTAGYFITDPNSRGEQNIIYYAVFKLGDSTVYVENAGTKSESESLKNELAAIIQQLINNGPLNLNSLSE